MTESGAPSRNRRVSVAAVLFGLGLLSAGCPAPSTPRAPQLGDRGDRGVWFEDLGDPLDVDVARAGEALRWVAGELGATAQRARLPAAWLADQAPRVVFLSASDGARPATVAVGRGHGVTAALTAAVDELRASGVAARWLKLDLVTGVGPSVDLQAGVQLGFDRNREGVASLSRGLLAVLPEQLCSHRLVDDDGAFDQQGLAEFLTEQGRDNAAAEVRDCGGRWSVYRFTSTSYLYADRQVVELYRGHPVATLPPSPDQLLAAARVGGDYLISALDADGAFAYTYQPERDTVEDDYNMVRHAGTVYAMLELWRETRDPRLLAAAERAVDRLLGAVTDFGEPLSGVAVMHYGGKIKLGGVALTVLALTEHILATGSRQHLEVARRLCRYLAAQQKPSGEFVHQRSFPEGEVRDFTSEYYPGEALFALARMYQVDGDRHWLDVAERGADFLIQVRDRGLTTDQLTHDHWLLYALSELYPERPRAHYLEHAMRIGEAIVGAQNRSPRQPDYLGSYGDPPRSTPVATRSEGLLAAYRLARDHRPAAAPALLAAARLGVGFQLHTQIGPARALYLPNPRRSLGGFTRSLSNLEVRIDYVQHNISSLLALRRALLAASPSRSAQRAAVSGPRTTRRAFFAFW